MKKIPYLVKGPLWFLVFVLSAILTDVLIPSSRIAFYVIGGLFFVAIMTLFSEAIRELFK